jgi:hypothetical protein
MPNRVQETHSIRLEAEVAVQPSVWPAGRLSGSQATAQAGGGGKTAGEWRGPGSCGLLTVHAGGRICNLVYRGWCWSGFIWERLVLPAGTAAVQHRSTATHPDAGGRTGTREDGDLHGWTRVDVLPPDGMQEGQRFEPA